jgi:type IV pilus assembly protein PilC
MFGYLFKVALLLVPVYGATALLILATRGPRGEAWRAGLERALHVIPLVGSGRRQLALSRCAAALEALISAGMGILEAWPLAAAASGSPALMNEVSGWRPGFVRGRTPAELLRESAVFPEMFANLYHGGEISGRLDETLKRLANYYSEEGTRSLRAAAQWFPRLVYFFIAGYIAWRVIQFWTGYFNQIGQVMGG